MNIWKIIYLNCRERYEDMIHHLSYIHNAAVVELKPENTSGLNGIRTHDLYGTDAVLCQLSYQANWELVTLYCENENEKITTNQFKSLNQSTYTSTKIPSMYFKSQVLKLSIETSHKIKLFVNVDQTDALRKRKGNKTISAATNKHK